MCSQCCCGCLCSTCELDELLRRVRNLREERGNLGDLVCRVPPPPVEEIPGISINAISLASQVDEILNFLSDETVVKVGIYGLCGVGKTPLLQAVNNELFRRSRSAAADLGFNMVIHVDLKMEQHSAPLIQRRIRDRLRLSDSDALSEAISSKKCLLLLDHVWDAVDWNGIGVPSPNPSMKVVFATPSRSVCDDMKAERSVRVNFLSEAESWELFCKTMDGRNRESWGSCSQYVKDLAKTVVSSCCGGLPGAILAIPPALGMNFTTSEAWDNIRDLLKNSPNDVTGMTDVFSSLQCVFDRLERNPIQMSECLLYCILFPESRNISKHQLVDYWIGEGFLDAEDYLCIGSVRRRGSRVIDNLQKACLLEIGDWDENEVKLHAVVRQMALWLTRDDAYKLLTAVRLRLSEMSMAESWQRATRISLMDSRIKELPDEISECPKLQTLLLNSHYVDLHHEDRCQVDESLDDLLYVLPELRVLDLSGTSITHLPASVGSLVKLKYLNVSHTNIISLPSELKNLHNLRLLNLRNTSRLSRIPHEAISSLSKLRILDLYCSSYEWSRERRYYNKVDDGGGRSQQERQISLEDLVDKKSLQEIGISLKTLMAFQGFLGSTVSSSGHTKFLRSKTFVRSTIYLSLDEVNNLREADVTQVFNNMRELRQLSISSCPELNMLEFRVDQLEELKFLSLKDLPLSRINVGPHNGDQYLLRRLRRLQIGQCHQLGDLTCIKEFRGLREISLTSCHGIQELITSPTTEDDTSLSELRKLTLVDLPSFSRFSSRMLSLPALEYIKVSGSSELRELPLIPSNLNTIKEILGEQAWWDNLEWNQDANADFHSYFKAL